ncbi:unnamed protein product [Oikopleura dioica]|uniref:Uncharacterized protein n=1 Tax=Oikopleura dioica TaxID=34765 RepID=E4X044_OIKDI|nr:unnamed protein product [Oikopleura dioica]
MTTAARPTFEPAKGGMMKGETDLGQLSKQVSTRDMPSQMTLKYRDAGQGNETEYENVDFKKKLEQSERKAREDRNKERGMYKGSSSSSSIAHSAITSGSSRTKNIDADEPIEDSDDDSSDEEDETADLLAELNKIKAEREEEKKEQEAARAEDEERIRQENILKGNPLTNESKKEQSAVKRRWDDDVVFKNCARQEPEKKKNFVNDTIRSDFHRRFMYKYIK